MPAYSKSSESKLDTCSTALQRLFRRVVQFYDNTIIDGHRSAETQLELYNSGASKVLHSKHNNEPSEAVDSGPYLPGRGIPWPKVPTSWDDAGQRGRYIKDLAQFYHYAGFVEAMAIDEGVNIRWGGDWDRDHNLSDQTFDDLVHFEELT